MKNSKITVAQLEKMNDEQLAEINLDDVNFDQYLKVVNNRPSLNKIKRSNAGMFKYKKDATNQEKKNLRTKARKFVNSTSEEVNNLFASKTNNKLLVEKLKAFDKFYKETYTLNDYSLESFRRKNSDVATIVKLKSFVAILQQFKAGKIK